MGTEQPDDSGDQKNKTEVGPYERELDNAFIDDQLIRDNLHNLSLPRDGTVGFYEEW